MGRKKRLAFVNARPYVGGSGLITMPFAFNAVLALQEEWEIDLFLGEPPTNQYREALSPGVSIHFIHRAVLRRFFPLKLADGLLRCVAHVGYDAVMGVGQVGHVFAHMMAALNRCPLLLFDDEFPSSYGRSRWTQLQEKAYDRCDVLITPDHHRFRKLCEEMPGMAQKPAFELPNVPVILKGAREVEVDWHERLHLPEGSVPVICAGGMDDYNQIPELLCSARSWEERFVLILRGVHPQYGPEYRKTVAHLDIEGRVFWYFDPLSLRQLDALIQSCALSFALYRDHGPNMREIGKASGKLLRSVRLGVPVIATNFPSLRFVSDHGLGILVDHPSEIADAMLEITRDRETYSKNCLRFAAEEIDYHKVWRHVEEALEGLVA